MSIGMLQLPKVKRCPQIRPRTFRHHPEGAGQAAGCGYCGARIRGLQCRCNAPKVRCTWQSHIAYHIWDDHSSHRLL